MSRFVSVSATRPNGNPLDGDYATQNLNLDAVVVDEYDPGTNTTLVTLASGQQIRVQGALPE